MGKTVPSYRMALESEISLWNEFKNSLGNDEDKSSFETIMDLARGHVSAGSNACKPILFEPLVISILLGQQKRIRILQRKIDALLIANLIVEKTQ